MLSWPSRQAKQSGARGRSGQNVCLRQSGGNHREHFQRKTPGQPTSVPLDHNLGDGCPVFRCRLQRVAVVPSPCISEVGYEHQRDGNADAGTYSCA